MVGCLENFLWDFDDDLAAAFTDENMQTLFSAIQMRTAGYDGTNDSRLHQLWFFARVAYFHEFFETAVDEFDDQTQSAHIAASNAFAASARIYDFNDEAALILAEWFAAADQDGVRQNHLTQVVHTLTTLTPDRAASAAQLQAYNSVFFLLFRGVGNNDAGFIDAVGRDPDIVAALLQAALYDFLDPDALYLLENATRELGRLTAVASLQGDVVTALTSVLTAYERLSSPFLLAAESLEEHVDCQELDVCRQVLEAEITERVFPQTYSFDDGALVFQTSLDLGTVQPLYHAAKQVEAQFFRLLELDRAVAGDANDVLYIKLYATLAEYGQFQGYLFDLDTNNGGIYIEQDATFYTYQRTTDESVFRLEELFRHEYVHYLGGRFVHPGLWGQTDIYKDCRLTWFDEGLAEFLAASTQAQGIPVRQALVEAIANDGADQLVPGELFHSCYSDGFKFYSYASLFFNLMHRHQRTELLALLDLVRSGDASAYDDLVSGFEADLQLAGDYAGFLNEQVAVADLLTNPTTDFPRLTALASAEPAEIEHALDGVDSRLRPECGTAATRLNHRFDCTGRLSAGDFVGDGDRGSLSQHFNNRLDSLITAAVEEGGINNFTAMNCYFTDVADGDPAAADFVCSGPLREVGTGLDGDGDGFADTADDFPANPLAWNDADGDGVVDAAEVADEDLDGMPDGWERLFGFDAGNAADALADADRDGVGNRVEFEQGSDPRDANSAPPRVDLRTDLRNDSQELTAQAESALNLYVGLRFSGAGATNVTLTYSASLPLRLEDVLKSGASTGCQLVAATEQTGTFSCGDLADGNTGLDLFLIFTPLKKGTLDFSVEFAAEELEVEPEDNVRFLDGLTIAPDPTAGALVDFDGDGVVGFPDFFRFADAFGGTDARFDLDASGLVDFGDFFIFADFFGWEAQAKLIALARELIGLPDGPLLGQNYPNPFNSQTTISFFLPQPGPVHVEVFALNGQQVAVLGAGSLAAGAHRLIWDTRDVAGRSVASGTYLYRLVTASGTRSRRLTLVR